MCCQKVIARPRATLWKSLDHLCENLSKYIKVALKHQIKLVHRWTKEEGKPFIFFIQEALPMHQMEIQAPTVQTSKAFQKLQLLKVPLHWSHKVISLKQPWVSQQVPGRCRTPSAPVPQQGRGDALQACGPPDRRWSKVVLVYSTCHEGHNPSLISAEKACSQAKAHDALSARSSRKACSPHQHLIGNMPCRVSYSPGETFILIHTNWYSCEKYQIPGFWKLYLPLFPDVKLIVILGTSGIWDACSEVMVTHINTLCSHSCGPGL